MTNFLGSPVAEINSLGYLVATVLAAPETPTTRALIAFAIYFAFEVPLHQAAAFANANVSAQERSKVAAGRRKLSRYPHGARSGKPRPMSLDLPKPVPFTA